MDGFKSKFLLTSQKTWKWQKIPERNFLPVKSCLQINFWTYQFSSERFVCAVSGWEWRQSQGTCSCAHTSPTPGTSSCCQAKQGAGTAHTYWPFISRLSIHPGSVTQNPLIFTIKPKQSSVFIVCKVWWWLTQNIAVRSRAIGWKPNFFFFFLFYSMGIWQVWVPHFARI